MVDLLLAVPTVLLLWDAVRSIPVALPTYVHPWVVVALSYVVLFLLPDALLQVGAVAGVVGVLHALLIREEVPTTPIRLSGRRRVPDLP